MTNLPALMPQTPGQIANALAAASVFERYADEHADNTLRQQERSLAAFARYLHPRGVRVESHELATRGEAWAGVTYGLVEGFRLWLLNGEMRNGEWISKPYAIGSINVMLSHIRVYAELAFNAGHLPAEEYQRIQAIHGIKGAAAANIDGRRDMKRQGHKKAHFNTLSEAQVDELLTQPATPRGRRNAVMLATLVYCGLRAGELAILTRADVSIEHRRLHVYRPKVKGTDQAHAVYRIDNPPALLAAYMAYLQLDAPADGLLLRGSKQNSDELSNRAMTATTISQEVAREGRRIGVMNLSAHDLRHTGATLQAERGTDVVRLRDWGGWASLNMPARYVARQAVANDGIGWD